MPSPYQRGRKGGTRGGDGGGGGGTGHGDGRGYGGRGGRRGGGPGGPMGGRGGRRPGAPAASLESNSMVMLLKLVIEKYSLQPVPTALNLGNLKQYEELAAQHLDFNAVRTCEAIVLCLQTHFPTVENVLLDNNKIKDPAVLFGAMKRFDTAGSFKGFSLRSNPIQDYGFLRVLKGFPSLQELQFHDCPISRDAGYRRQVSKTLPNLMLLDGEGAERIVLDLPWPAYPGGIEGQAREISERLLETYFQLVEEGKMDSLADLYHPNALLTLTLSPSFNFNASSGTSGSDLKVYHRISQELNHSKNRNLIKSGAASSIVQRVSKGYIDILGTLKQTLYGQQLRVKHVVNVEQHMSVSEPSAQVMEKPILIVTFHGVLEFRAPSSQERCSKKLFDRTWVVVPSPAGQIVIYNDMIHLRGYDLASMWDPHLGERSLKLQKRYGFPPAVADEIIVRANSDGNCINLAEVVANTRLRPETAADCLRQSGNNIENAMALFEERKGSIGPEHFFTS